MASKFVTIYLVIFCGRIIGALSSDWLLPLPPIRQNDNHQHVSQLLLQHLLLILLLPPNLSLSLIQQNVQHQKHHHITSHRNLNSTSPPPPTNPPLSLPIFTAVQTILRNSVKTWKNALQIKIKNDATRGRSGETEVGERKEHKARLLVSICLTASYVQLLQIFTGDENNRLFYF